MGVDHGGLAVFLTAQRLTRPDFISVLQEVGREGRLGGWEMTATNIEMRWRGKRVGAGGRCEILARVGSGKLSLVDPTKAPPSAVPGRWHVQETTLHPARLSSNAETTPRSFTALGGAAVGAGIFLAASPIISKLRTNALFNVASRRKDSKCVIGACERM